MIDRARTGSRLGRSLALDRGRTGINSLTSLLGREETNETSPICPSAKISWGPRSISYRVILWAQWVGKIYGLFYFCS